MNGQRLEDYLRHILAAIDRIHRYLRALDGTAFLHDEQAQDAVIRNIEAIGEASGRIRQHYPDFVKAHPELPLAAAYQMRNAVAHGYFEVDLAVVWKTATSDLPVLRRAIIDATSLQ